MDFNLPARKDMSNLVDLYFFINLRNRIDLIYVFLSFFLVPHSGSSYNPSLKDHQDLLWKAAIVEINKDKAEHKIEYHTTKMFSKLDQATIKKNWIEEMSEGVPKLDKSMAEETEENVVVRTISVFLIFRTSLTCF